MNFDRNRLVLLAGGGSAALLGGAYFVFQKLMLLPPCAMCYWQRYPHAAAIVIALAALFVPGPVLPLLGLMAALATAVIGVYHAGVERDYWEGPSSCTSTGNDLSSLSADSLLDTSAGMKVVLCDQISWEWLGLSMPAWNAVLSFGLVVVWALAVRASLRRG